MADTAGRSAGEGQARGQWVTDAVVGLTNGVANIPDAMANALLAGVSPVMGLYSLLVGTPVAALTTSSTYMTVAVTAAMAVTVGGGITHLPAEQRDAAVALMSLIVGAFMVAFGMLRGGRLLRFVSNAVMKGFLNGVAVLVIVGQLSNVTGFDSQGSNKFAKALGTLFHAGQWEARIVLVTLATIVIVLLLDRTRLASVSMLLALVIVTGFVYALGVNVPLVRSVSPIPSGLPLPKLPDLALLPGLVVPALSVALIGLVQGGGISKSFPNPGGSYPDASRDMIGQGFGNLAAGAVGGLPIGASVSSTAMTASGGAKSRLSNVVIGVVMAVVLLLLGPLVEIVPLAVLGGILLVVGVRAFDVPGMVDVWRASKESALVMAITLGSMLFVPVQYAVLLGAALSAVQYVYSSSKDVRVVALRKLADGRWAEETPPEFLPSNAVTVVDVYGSVFYAGVELVDRLLPSVGDATRPCMIVRLRGRSELGSTAIAMLRRYNSQISAAGGRLILAGASERLVAQLESTGLLEELGQENVLPATDVVFESTDAAMRLGQRWLDEGAERQRP